MNNKTINEKYFVNEFEDEDKEKKKKDEEKND